MLTIPKQKTTKSAISLQGVGVHSGQVVNLVIKPASEDHGVVFKRVDIPLNNLIVADYLNVVDTRLCTVLANDHGVKISTVEHLMAAFSAFGITNALIEIDAEEMPIMDGSSLPFVQQLEKVGVVEQNAYCKVIEIIKNVEYNEQDKKVSFSPAAEFSLEVLIDYDHPLIGKQNYRLGNIDDFKHNLSSARTFGFVNEVEMLRKMGLARGASLDNAIALTSEGVLNPEGFRYDDECVRHKALDLIGDFSLAGAYIKGKVSAYKPGHDLNNKVLRRLLADKSAYNVTPATAA
jgi:UDP-3-O-[3-hydroxymyristoyl] N-acetylglucosamine deacetylase